MPARPAGYHEFVKAQWRQTKGYVIASRQPCILIRDDEVKRIKRALVAASPNDLERLDPPKSWAMAVIVCPGDTLDALVVWARKHKAQGSRVWFFLHAGAKPDVLRPWRDAGFTTDQVDVVGSWEDLHRLFGAALNDQVYADFRP